MPRETFEEMPLTALVAVERVNVPPLAPMTRYCVSFGTIVPIVPSVNT